jgi:hypothetical protein
MRAAANERNIIVAIPFQGFGRKAGTDRDGN